MKKRFLYLNVKYRVENRIKTCTIVYESSARSSATIIIFIFTCKFWKFQFLIFETHTSTTILAIEIRNKYHSGGQNLIPLFPFPKISILSFLRSYSQLKPKEKRKLSIVYIFFSETINQQIKY